MANKIRATKASHLLLCKYTNAKVNKKQKSINSTSPLPSEENWKYLCIVNVQTNFFWKSDVMFCGTSGWLVVWFSVISLVGLGDVVSLVGLGEHVGIRVGMLLGICQR